MARGVVLRHLAGDGRARGAVVAVSSGGHPRDSRWELGGAGSRWGSGCGLVLGRGRSAPVCGVAGTRSNVPDGRNRRDVRRRGGDERLSFPDRSRVPVVGDLAVRDAVFLPGHPTGGALGAMVLVFTTALSAGARHSNLFFVENIRLRLELSRANRRLQDEIAKRQATEAALHQAQKLEGRPIDRRDCSRF